MEDVIADTFEARSAGVTHPVSGENAVSQGARSSQPAKGCLRPQTNACRTAVDLSGLWTLRFGGGNWQDGIPDGIPVGVPGSWNDQLPGARDEFGPAWYERRFEAPPPTGREAAIRFGSVCYAAQVWLNGKWLGGHEGGHLPFAVPCTERARRAARTCSSCGSTASSGGIAYRLAWSRRRRPMAVFFTPIRPSTSFPSPAFTVARSWSSRRGMASGICGWTPCATATERSSPSRPTPATATSRYPWTASRSRRRTASAAPTCGRRRVRGCTCSKPNLYRGGVLVDRYALRCGIRTVEVAGDELLLNGAPVRLRGFARHEDFPVLGRGVSPALAARDLHLMRQLGANSFRTAHYPCDEETLDLADQLGLMVIAETPAVALYFGDEERSTAAGTLAGVPGRDDRPRPQPRLRHQLVGRERAADESSRGGRGAARTVRRGALARREPSSRLCDGPARRTGNRGRRHRFRQQLSRVVHASRASSTSPSPCSPTGSTACTIAIASPS